MGIRLKRRRGWMALFCLAGNENPRLTAARQQPAITTSARRYVAFASLAQAYPDARLAFVGGYPDLAADSALSNAAVARQLS